MSNIVTLRAQLRLDLQDTNNERWSDAELDRALGRAVERYSLALPLETRLLYACVAGQRQYDLLADPSLTRLLAVRRLEYPAGGYPPSFIPFALVDSQNVLLLTEQQPQAGEFFAAWLDRYHLVDTQGSSLPAAHEALLAEGAAAYALRARAIGGVDRVSLSEEAGREYERLGRQHMERFEQELRRLRQLRSQNGGSTVSFSGYSI